MIGWNRSRKRLSSRAFLNGIDRIAFIHGFVVGRVVHQDAVALLMALRFFTSAEAVWARAISSSAFGEFSVIAATPMLTVSCTVRPLMSNRWSSTFLRMASHCSAMIFSSHGWHSRQKASSLRRARTIFSGACSFSRVARSPSIRSAPAMPTWPFMLMKLSRAM